MRIVDVEGGGLDRGISHGEQLRDRIGVAMERWRKSISAQRGMLPAEFAKVFLASTDYVSVVEEYCPDLMGEVRGIAIGSGESFEEIMAFNLLDEEWWFEPGAVDTGCSVISTRVASRDVDTPVTLLAQNMDLPLVLDGGQTLLRIRQPDAPEQIVLTAAGMIGLTGVNAAGLGICVNTLLSLRRSGRGLPVAFVFREALKRRDAESAAAFLKSVPHASGQHYALADPNRTIGIEGSAGGYAEGPRSQQLLHTNHPLWSEDLDNDLEVTTHWNARMQRSSGRLEALTAGVAQVCDAGTASDLLARTDLGLCVLPTPENQSTTFGSVEYVLTTPPTVRVALGRPNEVEWQQISWSSEQPRTGTPRSDQGASLIGRFGPGTLPLSQLRLDPGESTPLLRHDFSEYVYVTEGSVVATRGAAEAELETNASAYFPKDQNHRLVAGAAGATVLICHVLAAGASEVATVTHSSQENDSDGPNPNVIRGTDLAFRWALLDEFEPLSPVEPTKGNRIQIRYLFTPERGAPDMVAGIAHIAPHTHYTLHHHEPAEIYHVLEGTGTIYVDGEALAVSPGQSIFVPPNTIHGIDTEHSALKLLWLYNLVEVGADWTWRAVEPIWDKPKPECCFRVTS